MKQEFTTVLSSPRLLELLKNSKSEIKRDELKKNLSLSSSRLAQVLKKAEELELVERVDDKIFVLPKGKVILKFVDTVERYGRFLEVFGEYLNVYDLSDIPDWLMARFYELWGIEVIERREDILKPHDEFLENLALSEEIYGYTTVLFDEYIEFLEMAEKGKKIEVVANMDVLRTILMDYRKEFLKLLKYRNVKFYVSRRDFKFSFVVTDRFFSISFYFTNGLFDYKRDFVSESESARRWGFDLFDYVRDNADIVDIEKLKSVNLPEDRS